MGDSGYLDELPPRQQSSLLGAVHAQAHAEGSQSIWTQSANALGDQGLARQENVRSTDGDIRADRDIDSDSDVSSWDSEEHERQLQAEWEENVRQFQTIVQIMVLPFFGKWLGRKWSYWAFARWQLHGLAPSFFGLSWLFSTNSILPSSGVAALQP